MIGCVGDRHGFKFRFDPKPDQNPGWEILPPCPACGEDVKKARTEIVRVVEHVGFNEVIEDSHWYSPTYDEYTARAGVVYPCQHRFENQRDLYYYLVSFHGLQIDLDAMDRVGIDPEAIFARHEQQREEIQGSLLT